MLRLCFILAICLFSCRQSSVRKDHVVELTDSTNSRDDALPESKDAFHWRKWEKPKGRIYLTDELLKYVAKGHVAIDASWGDINQDGLNDLVVVTGLVKEDSLRFTDTNLPRHLLVFFGQKDGAPRFAFRNTKAIPCINCCGTTDSYGGHTALTGRFILKKYCASNPKTLSEYKFDYVLKLNDWLLDTIVIESYAPSNANYVLDTLTRKNFGKVSLKTFVMHKVKN